MQIMEELRIQLQREIWLILQISCGLKLSRNNISDGRQSIDLFNFGLVKSLDFITYGIKMVIVLQNRFEWLTTLFSRGYHDEIRLERWLSINIFKFYPREKTCNLVSSRIIVEKSCRKSVILEMWFLSGR